MGKNSFLLLISVTLLFCMGILMVFNTTAAEIIDRSVNSSIYYPLLRQIFYAMIGMTLAFFVWKIGYSHLLQMSPILISGLIIFLIFVFIPPIGIQINGAHRWIRIFGYTFQPAECGKYLIPFYFIYRLEKEGSIESFSSFLKRIVIVLIPIFLILLEPDNGSTAMILLGLMVLFYLAGIKLRYWALPFLIFVTLGAFTAYHMPHVPARIRIYLHPESDLLGKGHQPYQAKIAAGSGQFWGRGLGESLQKLNYLPEARSDYIAAIYAEELGFLGVSLLIITYMIITYAGISIAWAAREKKAFYMASIITFMISFQAFLNLGIVSGLLPSKGTTLPFFSQGGTSLMVNMAALAILLEIDHATKKIG